MRFTLRFTLVGTLGIGRFRRALTSWISFLAIQVFVLTPATRLSGVQQHDALWAAGFYCVLL